MNKLESMQYAGLVNLAAIEHGFITAKPGVSLATVNAAIEEVILGRKCKPAFKNYQPEGYPSPFPAAACISPNDVVVHGIPGEYIIQDGDLLTIDVGTEYQGYFVDAARSRVIGNNDKAQKLVDGTESVLQAELSVIRSGCTLMQVVEAAEEAARMAGITIMPQWGGHGIADQIHMDPFVPNAIDRNRSDVHQKLEKKKYEREVLRAGQTICIEPVTTYGAPTIIVDEDKWTIRQVDGELAAHTERCLLVTEEGYKLLS